MRSRFGEHTFKDEVARDGTLTLWMPSEKIVTILQFLKSETTMPYRMLYDLTAIDERAYKRSQNGHIPFDFTVVYHLFSFERNQFLRLKTGLRGDYPSLSSITHIWPAANWYEREVFDMFGIRFDGHPLLKRILMPTTWEGHPLRKEHPARATEMGPFRLFDEKEDRE